MAEQDLESPIRWERSPDYRTFFCNHFKFRFNVGDVNITLSQFDEDPGSPIQNIIREQINFTMSWPQLKQFALGAAMAIKEMESETGPIPNTGPSPQELEETASSIVKGFLIRKP